MPSDDSTVATQADFVPMAVGNTDRVRSVVSVSAHDGVSQQPRPEVHETQLNVLVSELEYFFPKFSVGSVRLVHYCTGPCNSNGTFHLLERISVFPKLSVEVDIRFDYFPYDSLGDA